MPSAVAPPSKTRRSPIDPGDFFIGVQQAAHLLGESHDTITRWCATGKLRSFQPFKHAPWRVSRNHVMELVHSARRQLAGIEPPPSSS